MHAFAKTTIMKKIFNLTLLIVAITLVLISCKKEQDASLINIWEIERLGLKEVTFNSGVSTVEQVMIRAFLATSLEEYINPDLVGWTFEFREDGKVFLADPKGNIHDSYDFTTTGNVLSVAEDFMTGAYTISKNKMHWDINPVNFVFGGSDDFGEMGITGIIFRLALNKK